MVAPNPVKCDQCGGIVQPPPAPPFVCEYCGTPLPMPQMPAGHIYLTDESVTSMLREQLTGVDATWVTPSIPPKKLKNVQALHAAHLEPDEAVLALYDGTAFGSAKDGWIVTAKRMAWKNQMEDAQFLEWHQIDPDEIWVDGKKLKIGRAKLESLFGKEDDDLYAWEEAVATIVRSARPDLAQREEEEYDDSPKPPDKGWGGASVAAGGGGGQGGASWGGMAGGPAPGGPAWMVPTAAPPGGWHHQGVPDTEHLGQAPYEVDTGCSVVATHPSGQQLVAAGGGRVQLRNAAGGHPQLTIEAPESVLTAAISPDGAWLLVGGLDNKTNLYDLASGQHRGTTKKMKDYCDEVVWLGPTRFAAASQQGEVWILDASSMQRVHKLLGPDPDYSNLGGIAATPDGARLWASIGNRLGCFDTQTGKILWRLDQALENAARLAVSPAGDVLVAAGYDGIAFFDARTGQPGARFPFRCPRGVTWPEGGGGVFRRKRDEDDMEWSWSPRPRFSPLGDTVAVADYVGNLNFLDVATAMMHPTPRDRGRAWIEDIAWFGDGNHVLVGMSDNSMAVWSVRPMTLVLHCEAMPPYNYD